MNNPKFKRVVVILADGARPDVLRELMDSGDLPAIRENLVEKGTSFNAVTAFPSTTGPAYMPFLTGCLPATCNVPGIRWMDKVRYAKDFWHFSRHRSYVGLETYLIGRDMRRELPTIFELLPKSYNIFNSVNKGVSFKGNMTRLCRIWYWYYAHLTDHWGFVDKTAIKKYRRALSKDFDLIFMILPGIDEYSHIVHYKNPETIDAYKRVDQAIDLTFYELEKEGKLGETLIWLVSDHGLSVTHSHFCINKFLEDRGIRTLYYPKIFRKNCVAANMMSGNGMSHLYFKHDHGWQYPMYRSDIEDKYPGMVDELVSEDAIDILASRVGPGIIEVKSKRGRGLVRLEGERLEYSVDGADPFGFKNIGKELTSDESLHLTIDSDYPDALYQLAHIFNSPRCGDIVVSAKKGFDLRDEYEFPEHKGSHGSLHREHMVVPVMTNAKLNVEYARTIDLFPTTLKLLNHPLPANLDGKSLVSSPL